MIVNFAASGTDGVLGIGRLEPIQVRCTLLGCQTGDVPYGLVRLNRKTHWGQHEWGHHEVNETLV